MRLNIIPKSVAALEQTLAPLPSSTIDTTYNDPLSRYSSISTRTDYPIRISQRDADPTSTGYPFIDTRSQVTPNGIPPSVPLVPSKEHMCYIILSLSKKRVYIGYTVDFTRRLRQHNGEIVGGAKKTVVGRPWTPICTIHGFIDASMALRFEYRLQHPSIRKQRSDNPIMFTVNNLQHIIYQGDGSKQKDTKCQWPELTIKWYNLGYTLKGVTNIN
jgi:predicted GIY-YIG superfamily endonuclease